MLRRTPVAVWASIGPTGCPTRSVNSDSAVSPPVRAAAATAGRSPPSIAARRTVAAGSARGLGDGVGHHPGERALPQLAAEEPAQERLLGLRCRGEQVRDEPRPAGL